MMNEDSQKYWIFNEDYPQGTHEKFEQILVEFESEKLLQAEKQLRELLLVVPYHIEAWYYFALIFHKSKRDMEAYLCWREAVRIGLDQLPKNFSWTTWRMNWGHLENRPFMRSYYALGSHIYKVNGTVESFEIFANLVSINPNDNLGARFLLMQTLLQLSNWDTALNLAYQFPNDASPDILYSKVIALTHLRQIEEAIDALKLAIQYKPNVAREILKARHIRPKSRFPNTITAGGEDEAFDYWERNRIHWTPSTESYQLLTTIFGSKK